MTALGVLAIAVGVILVVAAIQGRTLGQLVGPIIGGDDQ